MCWSPSRGCRGGRLHTTSETAAVKRALEYSSSPAHNKSEPHFSQATLQLEWSAHRGGAAGHGDGRQSRGRQHHAGTGSLALRQQLVCRRLQVPVVCHQGRLVGRSTTLKRRGAFKFA